MTQKNIPICVPKLPLAEHITPYLQQIDTNRWYTNYGPLVCDFLERMAKLFRLNRSGVISATNGTVLLELCLKALEIPEDSLCIMPSWTFVATPLAAVNAKLKPFFIDVDLETQTITPEKLEQDLTFISQHGKIGAVIVVTPFGMPVNITEWDSFTERTGIPVIVDAAAGFDSVLQLPQMQISHTPVMISLHATKVLGVGEGAILLSKNEDLIRQVECLTQFGFPRDVRNAALFGTNAKISEYVGAVGLAALDIWHETRASWQKISSCYQDLLNAAGIQHTLSPEWVPSTCNVLLPNQADFVATQLHDAGIMTRKWYGDGCHLQSVFKYSLSTHLKNTEYLASATLGLPFYIGMEVETIEKVVKTIVEIAEETSAKINAA